MKANHNNHTPDPQNKRKKTIRRKKKSRSGISSTLLYLPMICLHWQNRIGILR